MFCTKALQNSELISIDKRFLTIAYKYVWSSGLDIILPSRWPEFPQAFYSYFVDIQNLSNFQGKYLLSAYKRQQVTFLTKKYPFMKTPGCCQTLALLCRLWKNCIWKLHFYYVTWFNPNKTVLFGPLRNWGGEESRHSLLMTRWTDRWTNDRLK